MSFFTKKKIKKGMGATTTNHCAVLYVSYLEMESWEVHTSNQANQAEPVKDWDR